MTDSTALSGSRIPPWPEGHALPKGAPMAIDVIEDVLQEAFKGNTGVDLRLLAADVVDALQGDKLRVELRWFDETDEDYLGAGVYVLTDDHWSSLRMRVWSSLVHHLQSMERALWLPGPTHCPECGGVEATGCGAAWHDSRPQQSGEMDARQEER